MKSKEWGILGFLLMGLGLFFIQLDLNISLSCIQWISEPIESISNSCIILSEIYDPFIWAFFSMWIICLIMAFVVWLDERKIKGA